MVFCNFCGKWTDENYRCNWCRSNLKEGRKVTCQFTNVQCDFKNCNVNLPHKGVVWNVNYSYFHLTCYEKKLKMGVVSSTPPPKKPKKTTSSFADPPKKDDDEGNSIFDFFKKKKKEKKINEIEPGQGDIMDSLSGIDWPTTDQIDNAISNLKEKSTKDEIRHFQIVENMMGDPLSFPGQFARVYKMQDSKNNKKSIALRFFSKKKKGSMNRYRILHEYFESYSENNVLNFFIGFNFLKDAVNIFVNKKEYQFPIIKMDWIEGKTLEKFLKYDDEKEDNYKRKIKKLKINFKKIIDEMEHHEIAHGDLHPKNIIITKNNEIKLVDYDCLYITKFMDKNMPELGDPDCQHPNRKNFKYDHTIDRFSAFVLYFALSILEDNPECSDIRDGEFIFSRADYENPEKSETFKKINELPSPEIQYFLKILKDICKKKKPSIEPLSSIIENTPSIKKDNDKN